MFTLMREDEVRALLGQENQPLIAAIPAGVTSSGRVGPRLSLRCPHCRQQSTFDPIEGCHDVFDGSSTLATGERICGNPECQALIHFIFDRTSRDVVRSYPPERLEFDPSHLPPKVRGDLEEAVTCHAHGAYRGAAALIRRALEDMCVEQGLVEGSLKSKLKRLQERTSLADFHVQGLHELRLLGNDSLHAFWKHFDDVDKETIEAALELVTHVLNVVYQQQAVAKRLEAMRVSDGPASEH